MTLPAAVETALARLATAVARVEDAVERRTEEARGGPGRDAELQVLAEDRARLAQDLDESVARTARLEHANRDVSRRLDHAIDAIRAVVEPERAPARG